MLATTHKWGYVATHEYCHNKRGCRVVGSFDGLNGTVHAIVARNVYDAIASGYAYHKRGAECWLNENLQPNPYPQGGNDHMRRTDWWAKLNATREETRSHSKNTNFCEVLVSLNETVGLRAYAEFAYYKWYADAYAYIAGHRSTRIWCLQDLQTHGRRLNKLTHSTHEDLVDRVRHIREIIDFDKSIGNKYSRIQSMTNCSSEYPSAPSYIRHHNVRNSKG